ncbi:MAG: T9SS type A sorting domain-containing protein [bacterium]
MVNKTLIFLLFLLCIGKTSAQDCKLSIGTNLSGVVDWTTEIPFVDMMHTSREWYTQNSEWVDGGNNDFNTGFINQIPMDENGYPLEMPYSIAEAETTQVVKTIWDGISAWPVGDYTLLYEGEGEFSYWGDLTLKSDSPGRKILTYSPPLTGRGIFELGIVRSNPPDHVRNVRLLMPGTENTYDSNPFYSLFLDRLKNFTAIRFMDWGRTNNWGNDEAWYSYDEDSDSIKVNWDKRAKIDYHTWATNKGVPYEIMIDLCNRLNTDMWICVPHSASDNYITNLAQMLKASVKPNMKIYIEYGNENWNWMFGQTQWLFKFGCQYRGIDWPEGIVSYIQNCLDIFSNVFADEMSRIIRVVGVQAAWQDVSNRIVFNMRPGSFDVYAPAAYFGLSEQADSTLDEMGSTAKAADIAYWARKSRTNETNWLTDQKNSISNALDIPMIYYEAGQHLTPQPFGEEPTYADALIDVQRDTSMYNLYNEWFTFLESLNDSPQPTLFMNFSFVAERSARYGSWGILESLNQDTSLVPAPKYKSIMEYIDRCGGTTAIDDKPIAVHSFELFQNYPNPFNPTTTIKYSIPANPPSSPFIKGGSGEAEGDFVALKIYDVLGNEVATLVNEQKEPGYYEVEFNASHFASGVYFCELTAGNFTSVKKLLLMK